MRWRPFLLLSHLVLYFSKTYFVHTVLLFCNNSAKKSTIAQKQTTDSFGIFGCHLFNLCTIHWSILHSERLLVFYCFLYSHCMRPCIMFGYTLEYLYATCLSLLKSQLIASVTWQCMLSLAYYFHKTLMKVKETFEELIQNQVFLHQGLRLSVTSYENFL